MIFIDEKGRCNGVRITCDNICYDRKIKELNEFIQAWMNQTAGVTDPEARR
ncbi:MAG: hypothetical protein MZV63_07900 [Marinilabiliales bacterium]|nr:hypothetical protein [Marinilabiliales bacterium]